MRVLTEFETMRRVAERGLSLARFGRCEFRLMQMQRGLAQDQDPILCRTLRRVVRTKPGRWPVLICLPRIYDAMPPGKAQWYGEFTSQRARDALLVKEDRTYGSTFVSRRDAWVEMEDEKAYWRLVRGIWQDRDVLLLVGSPKGLQAGGFLNNAVSVKVLQSLERNAWADRDRLMEECLAWVQDEKPRDPLVYLALGATATVLAHDLTILGIQALDLGHMAGSWLKQGKQARMAAA